MGGLCVLFSCAAIFYNLTSIGNPFVSDDAAYDVSISKQTGSIIAKNYNGETIASGVSNLDDAFVIQKAFDYFTQDGSNGAIEQIRHLEGQVDILSALKDLLME